MWLDSRCDESGDFCICRFGSRNYGGAHFPAMAAIVVRDTPDRVSGAIDQVTPAIAVEINAVLPIAARHELRHADRACVGAAHATRIEVRLSREQQVVLELASEIIGARRIVEG